jgi:CBS domain containing-hemolysin-like protein
VIVDGSGRADAVVSEAAVAATPDARRPWVDVGTLGRRVTPAPILDADLEGDRLLAALQSEPASEYLVVERDGSVFGVLATSDVTAAMSAAPIP